MPKGWTGVPELEISPAKSPFFCTALLDIHVLLWNMTAGSVAVMRSRVLFSFSIYLVGDLY